MNFLLESYINGNISYVREQMTIKGYALSELLDLYIADYQPSMEDVQLFIKRLEA